MLIAVSCAGVWRFERRPLASSIATSAKKFLLRVFILVRARVVSQKKWRRPTQPDGVVLLFDHDLFGRDRGFGRVDRRDEQGVKQDRRTADGLDELDAVSGRSDAVSANER